MKEALNKADCVQIRPDETIALGDFWVGLLNHPSTLSLAQSSVLGQTRARISMGRLREIEVPVPPVVLQAKYRDQVRRIDVLKRKLLGQSEYQRNLFISLQHRAFRGEL